MEYTKLEQAAIAIQNEAKTMSIICSDGAAIKLARAGVEALRKPNITVIEAEPEGEFDISNSAAHAKAYWEAMIDAILNEKSE